MQPKQLNADDYPIACDDPMEGTGALLWSVFAALVWTAVGVAWVGYPRIGGAILVATSVVLGFAFAPRYWWRL